MKKTRLAALFLALVLLLMLLPMQALATEAESTEKINVAFVIDGSGSLINGHRADVEGNRYEAMDYFLDLLAKTGNNAVSAIVFNANTSSNTDRESMMKGLALNTGLVTITTDADKEDLKTRIREAHVGGYTDIGTALLTAAETLEQQAAANGGKSAIILFTDGSTELPSNAAYQQSLANRDSAVSIIKNKGIDLFGLFLNHKNTSSSTEVFDLVRDANGFPSSATPTDLSHRYFAVTSSQDLQAAFESFYTYIIGVTSDSFPVNTDKTFLVPGIGVEDVNISIMASPAVLSQISVTLTRPNGTVYTDEELAQILSRGKTYALYKINAPEAGLWTVRVNAPTDDIVIDCKLIVNVSIAAAMTVPQTIPGKIPFQVAGNLTYKGQVVTDPASYREYECTLRVVNTAGQETLYPMTLADSGFVTEATLPAFDTYYANVIFTCGDSIRISSDSMVWKPVNSAPQAPGTYTIKTSKGLLGGKKDGRVDLAELVQDPEDPDTALRYALDKGSYPAEAVTLDGSLLTVDGVVGGAGTMTVTFTDADGGQATTILRIKFANTVVLEIVLLVLGLLLIVAAVCAYLYIRNRKLRLEGRVTLTLPLIYEGFEHEIVLDLDGCLVANKTLAQVLDDNRDDFRRAIQNNYQLRPAADRVVSAFLQTNEIELSRVRFGATMGSAAKKGETPPVYCVLTVAAAPAKSRTTGQARRASKDVLTNGKSARFPLSAGPGGRVRHFQPQEANNDTFVW